MSFLFINKFLWLSNLKIRTDMNAKISVFIICAEVIIYLVLYSLDDCTFKCFNGTAISRSLVLPPSGLVPVIFVLT